MSGAMRPPGELDFSNTQKSWPEWRKRFERYRSASGLSEKGQQRQVDMLVYSMGEEAEAVAGQIVVREPRVANEAAGIVAEVAEDTLYVRTIEGFDAYFNPRNNHLHYAVLFGTRIQQVGESNEHFIRNLHELASKCTGWDVAHREDMLRTRLLAGMRDKELSRELQINANITLDQIKQQLRTKEIIEQNQRAEIDDKQTVLAVGHRAPVRTRADHRQQSGQSSGPSEQFVRECRFCGGTHAKGRCPAYGKRCNKCRRFGHFGRVCQNFTVGSQSSQRQVNEIQVVNGSDDEDNAFSVFTVSNVSDVFNKDILACNGDKASSQWVLDALVNGTPLKIRVDTGAEVSVMPKDTFMGLGCSKVVSSKARLSGCSGREIPVIGRAELSVQLSGSSVMTTFYVADQVSETLLGFPAIKALGLIPGLSSLKQVSAVDAEGLCIERVMSEHKEVFEGLGKFGDPVELALKNTAVPKAVPPRLVPHNLRRKLKVELDRLESSGVIVKDDKPSQWVSPLVIVNKPNGGIRLCLDPQYLNSQLVRSPCSMSTTTEIFARIAGSKYYSSLDARQGFHQIRLEEQSSRMTSFITPYGKFRYVRLPMGICSAPEMFHQRMVDAMAEIPGVEVYIDDLLVHAPTLQEHNVRLGLVLEKCKRVGLTLNPDKCVLARTAISYLGHDLSAKGVRPSHTKVEAVEKMVVPDDKKAVERFLGFINYLAKFIPNLSEHAYPLRQVCKKNCQFMWESSQAEAFAKIKELIMEAPTLALYDESKPVILSADSSAHSLGAVLLQDERPIEFAARSLTDCQQRYSQIEKEFLAILFACERFKYYCWGQECIVVETDHLPLLGILEKDINSLSPRLAAMRLKLLSYPVKLELIFRPGREMVLADTLSRACPQGTDLFEDLEVDPLLSVCSVVIKSDDVLAKYQSATMNDEELAVVKRYILGGWPSHKKSCADRAHAYWNLRQCLSVVNEVVFYGARLVVPISLRPEVLAALHVGHQGVTKTLQRATASVFWPGLRRRLEEKSGSCEACQKAERAGRKEPLLPMEVPPLPFHTVGVDLFSLEGQDYLLLVDYFTKWPVVKLLRQSTTSKVVIEVLKEIFSDFGQPEIVISDNGPQFSGGEFKEFCKDRAIKHRTSSPLHPSGNGQVERTVGTVKSMMRKCMEGGTDWYQGLAAIRNTPIAEGLPSPARLLQGRSLRDKMPLKTCEYVVREYDLAKVREALGVIKGRDKYFHDRRSGPESSLLPEGQQVHLRSAQGNWIRGEVIRLESDRSYSIRTGNGTVVRRNRKDLRPSEVSNHDNQATRPSIIGLKPCVFPTGDHSVGALPSDCDQVGRAVGLAADGSETSPAPVCSRAGRQLKKPAWHRDYDMN